MTIKMVIVMRNDLNMRKGKMVAQGAHAATMCFLNREDGNSESDARIYSWIIDSHMVKICVRVDSESELLEISQKAAAANLEVHVITDAGITEFAGVPTKTCLSIGPNDSAEIDRITGHLKLL